MTSNQTKSSGSLPAWKWTGAETLQLVHELNDRSLQVPRVEPPPPPMDASGADNTDHRRAALILGRELSDAARHRASRCPFLLIDARFQDLGWWQDVTNAEESESQGHAMPLESVHQPARELMTEMLMLAWHTARSDRRTAAVLLGLTSAVARVISGLGPPGVRRIAVRHCAQLRLRWPRNARFWKQLTAAAQHSDQDLLTDVHLYGLQLIGADVLLLGGRKESSAQANA